MQRLSFVFLFVGILLGGFAASQILHFHPLALASVITSTQEDYVESDALLREHFREQGSFPKKEERGNRSVTATSTGAIKIPVMVYHSVRAHVSGESAIQDQYDITPELLESELVYLKEHGYTTIQFAQVIGYFDHDTPLPEKPVILSFDDGWENQYTHAFPLLKKYGMTGTFFIYTNPIDHQKKHWMTWKQVVALDQAGMEVAGHSRTHPMLTKITTDQGLDKEILGSKQILEQHLGHTITVFAYPFGMRDARVITAVKRAGYLLARTTHAGVWNNEEYRYEFTGQLSTDNIADFERLLKLK